MNSPREDLPRVSVNSAEDWKRVKTNFAHVTLSELDSSIGAGSSHVRRDPLKLHVNHFLARSFTRAEPNLRINGRSFEELGETEQESEPFDETLDKKIWSLADQRLKLDQQIAIKRRAKPQEVRTSLGRDLRFDELHEDGSSVHEEDVGMAIDDELSDKCAELQQAMGNITAVTQELQQSMPIQVERSKRVDLVVREVKNIKP